MQVMFREIHDSKLLVAFGILPLLITIALYFYDRFHVKPIPEQNQFGYLSSGVSVTN